jgi:hypothetical protein
MSNGMNEAFFQIMLIRKVDKEILVYNIGILCEFHKR